MAKTHEPTARAWAFALSIGSIALLMLGLQPLILGELLESGRVSLEGVGIVAMAEIVGLGLGVLLGDLALPLSRLRAMTALAALGAGAADLLTLRTSGDMGFALTRSVAGLGEGVLVWSCTGVLVRSANPERKGGVFFVLQTASQGIAGLALARWVIPMHGWAGGFVLLAMLTWLAAVLATGLPRGLDPLNEKSAGSFSWSVRRAMPLAVSFLVMASLGSLWAYVEPLGKAAGFESMGIQTLIAAGLGMQVIGGVLGSVLVRRLPARSTLSICSLMLALSAYGVGNVSSGGLTTFSMLCGVFTFVWLFIAPFQIGLAFGADSTGRVASLIPAAQLFGVAFGPLVASLLVDGEQAGHVPFVSVSFALLTFVALLQGRRQRQAEAIAPGR